MVSNRSVDALYVVGRVASQNVGSVLVLSLNYPACLKFQVWLRRTDSPTSFFIPLSRRPLRTRRELLAARPVELSSTSFPPPCRSKPNPFHTEALRSRALFFSRFAARERPPPFSLIAFATRSGCINLYVNSRLLPPLPSRTTTPSTHNFSNLLRTRIRKRNVTSLAVTGWPPSIALRITSSTVISASPCAHALKTSPGVDCASRRPDMGKGRPPRCPCSVAQESVRFWHRVAAGTGQTTKTSSLREAAEYRLCNASRRDVRRRILGRYVCCCRLGE
jgi:hypothetical protein